MTDSIRAVRRRLATEGPPWTRPHEADFATVTLPGSDCDLVRDLLLAEHAGSVIEVGLAYASSALAIGEALAVAEAHGGGRHIVIDPFQHSAYHDVGWGLLCDAGLDKTTTLMRTPSSLALAQLRTEGVTVDAAFVDGSHRFHEVFVDLYHLRHLVRPGGLIITDDTWAPSVSTAVRYFERNLGWVKVPLPRESRCEAFRLPDVPSEPAFEDFQPF